MSAFSDAIAKCNGYWPCQDDAASTTIIGETGGNLTLSGSTTTALKVAGPTSWLPSALDLGGSYYATSTLAAPTGSAVRTAFAWVKASDISTEGHILSSGTGGNGEYFTLTPEGGLRLRHGGGNLTAGTITVDTWHFIASVVPSGATTTDDVLFYVDGVAVTPTRTGGTNQTLNTDATNWMLGSNYDSIGTRKLLAAVAGPGVSDLALTAADIAALTAGPPLYTHSIDLVASRRRRLLQSL